MPPSVTSQPDLVIRDALLIDGSGRPGVRGDLAVKDDRIAAMGDLSRRERRAARFPRKAWRWRRASSTPTPMTTAHC